MPTHRRRANILLAGIVILASCISQASPSAPRPSPTPAATPTPRPTPTPSPTPIPTVEIPLAVITGYTNLRDEITAAEVNAALAADSIIQACELFSAAGAIPRCLPQAEIGAFVATNPPELALIPWSLVTPLVKVLPVDGADLFGSADARAKPYPFNATVEAAAGWEPYDAEQIRT
ncbi:MAG: hypothetical protein ACRDGJ_00275, partial [Candidatus Limnocylindria bacterium]